MAIRKDYNGPFFISQSWGRSPDGLLCGVTTSEKRAKAALRRWDRERKGNPNTYAAIMYRILRCEDRAALNRAEYADFGATPLGCSVLLTPSPHYRKALR